MDTESHGRSSKHDTHVYGAPMFRYVIKYGVPIPCCPPSYRRQLGPSGLCIPLNLGEKRGITITLRHYSMYTCAGVEGVCQPDKDADTVAGAGQPRKIAPLPFLGRSQSLVNIPLSLDRGQMAAESQLKPPAAAVQQQPSAPNQLVTVLQPVRKTAGKRCCTSAPGKTDIKFSTLPNRESPCNKNSQHRKQTGLAQSARSKSVDSKSAAQQPQQQQQCHHDLNQVLSKCGIR